MKQIGMLLIAIALGFGCGCSSTSNGPSGSDRSQLPASVRDLGVLETSWGKKRCFESMMPRSYAAPVYPIREKQAGITGRLTAAVYVGTNGRVIDVSIMASSGNSALDTAGKAALQQWRFEPVTDGGAPIEFVAVQRMSFALE